MTNTQAESIYTHSIDLFLKHQLSDGFKTLNELIVQVANNSLVDQNNYLYDNYLNILRYGIGGKDNEGNEIYQKLIVECLELADNALELWTTGRHDQRTFKKQLIDAIQNKKITDVSEIFHFIHILGKPSELEKEIIEEIFFTDSYNSTTKSCLLGALLLSTQRCFDQYKINLFFNIVKQEEPEIWQRAFILLVLLFYQYDKRFTYYPLLLLRYASFFNDEKYKSILNATIMQLLRSKDTPQISKKLNEEILPEVQKTIRKNLSDKLGLDDMFGEAHNMEENPEWSKIFEGSKGLYEKLEEMSRMQMEGSDILMSAFGNLKHFDFFNSIHNWFMPFDVNNTDIYGAFDLPGESSSAGIGLIEDLSKAAFICNSDKYSFCLNVKMIPSVQKQQMLMMISAEMAQMRELSDEERLVDAHGRSRIIAIQYIQDLYRFFMLFPQRNQYINFFEQSLDFHLLVHWNTLFEAERTSLLIAEFYFSRGYYNKALEVYNYLQVKANDFNYELIEKTGYCCQKLGHFKKALEMYHQLEFIDRKKDWVLRNMVFCYRKLKQSDKALIYAHQLEKLLPEDLANQLLIGNCYLDLKNYEKALKYFFKIEFLQPENKKILRPIAWCCFVLGKFEQALGYYNQLKELSMDNPFDNVNMGHVYWSKGEIFKAKEQYTKSLKMQGYSIEQLQKDLLNDKNILMLHGIESKDIFLMLEFVKLSDIL